MSIATENPFVVVDAPPDESPPTGDPESGPYAHLYPDSTPEAPYGRKPDGTPYKRHHSGMGGSKPGTGKRMPASDKLAENAASLLARANHLIGIALTVAGMPRAADELAANNALFETMAAEALSADPALCRKILSTGATGGKAGLVMAYAVLCATTYPALAKEYRENHPKEVEGE